MTTVANDTLPTRTIVAGFLAFALMGAAQAMYGPSIPRLGGLYGEELSRTGLILSAHAFGALVGVLGSVPLERTALARWRAALSVVLIALGGLTLGLGPNLGTALVGAVVVGLGYGGLTLGLNGLFSRAFGERSGAMLNLLNAMFGVGSIVGPLVVSLAVGLDPRVPFVVLAAACALAAPLALSLDDRLPPVPERREPTSTPLLLAFVALLVLGIGVEASSAGWAATYLVTLGASAGSAATFTAVYFTAFTVGRFVAAWLSLRVPPARFVAGALGLALAALLLAHVQSFAPAALALLGFALAGFFPNAFLWLARAMPGARGGAAVVIAGALLGAIVFPAIVGQAVALGGGTVIPTVVAGVAALALVAALLLARRTGV